jgi:hypothetical protein
MADRLAFPREAVGPGKAPRFPIVTFVDVERFYAKSRPKGK